MSKSDRFREITRPRCGDKLAEEHAMLTQRAGPIDICIGDNIRAIRQARGLTMAQVGDALGVSYVHVQMYEKARARITFSKLCVLSELLHVPVSAFYATLEDPSTNQPIPSVEIEDDLFFFRLDALDPMYVNLIGQLAEGITSREGNGENQPPSCGGDRARTEGRGA